MRVYPSPPTGLSLATVGLWAENTWTEIFPATDTLVFIAGVSFAMAPTGGQAVDLQFARGAAGEEEIVHTYRIEVIYNVNNARQYILFPVPLGHFPIGVRISCRIMGFSLYANVMNVMYYENLVSGHKSIGDAKPFPYNENSFSATWGLTAWQNSDWYEITSGEDSEFTLTDFQFVPKDNEHCAAEFDLAKGSVGTEHANILTTKRFLFSGLTGFNHRVVFPGGFPIPPGTRVVFRIRRAVAVLTPKLLDISFNAIRATVFLS
jgi:hypothetical protein